MKKIVSLLILISMTLVLQGANTEENGSFFDQFEILKLDQTKVYFRKGNIELIKKGKIFEKAIITSQFELYIENSKLDLTKEQREIVKAYYLTANSISRNVRLVARSSVNVGIEGIKLGAKSVISVLDFILSGMDEEDEERMEAEIEKQAEILEEKAESIEELADEIDSLSDELEDIHDELIEMIPQLADFY